MHRLGRVGLAAVVTSLLAVPAAGAATVRGTVVAPPAVHGAKAVVPVLAAGGRSVKLVVARTQIRTSSGRIGAGDLRFGDRVTATGARGAAARPRVSRLRVTRRGSTASFARIASRRAATVAQVRAAIAQVAALPDTTKQIAGTPADPAVVRSRLRDVRTDVNLAIADLRAQAGALESAVSGAATVARGGGGAYLAGLTAGATDARKAADALDVAVGHLDEVLNAVGGESDPSIPLSSTAAVSDVLHQLLDLLRGLPGANPTG
jgi:hypothetical protein